MTLIGVSHNQAFFMKESDDHGMPWADIDISHIISHLYCLVAARLLPHLGAREALTLRGLSMWILRDGFGGDGKAKLTPP